MLQIDTTAKRYSWNTQWKASKDWFVNAKPPCHSSRGNIIREVNRSLKHSPPSSVISFLPKLLPFEAGPPFSYSSQPEEHGGKQDDHTLWEFAEREEWGAVWSLWRFLPARLVQSSIRSEAALVAIKVITDYTFYSVIKIKPPSSSQTCTICKLLIHSIS